MKNSKLTLIIAACVIIASFFAGLASGQTSRQEEPRLSVALTTAEWNVLLQIIDQSAAPHATVASFQKEIVSQLEKQIQKAAADNQKEQKK